MDDDLENANQNQNTVNTIDSLKNISKKINVQIVFNSKKH